MNILNTLGYGGTVAAIGLLIVFAGLIILIFSVTVMAKGIHKTMPETNEAPAPAAIPSAPVPQEEAVVNDAELIAVIAAAITAFDHSGKQLIVRRVRRISGWNQSSRGEQVYRF